MSGKGDGKGKTEVKTINSIKDLTFDDKNANVGTPRGRGMIGDSVQKLGLGRSVLADKNGKLIAGNKTTEIAGEIGMEDVIVVQTDGTKLVIVQRTDLNLDEDPEARELAVMDNRTSETSLHWDIGRLREMEENGVNLSSAFLPGEIDTLAAIEAAQANNNLNDAQPPEEFPAYDENMESAYKCPKCAYAWSGKAN